MRYIQTITIALTVALSFGLAAKAELVELFAIGQQQEGQGDIIDDVMRMEEEPQSILYSIDPGTGIPTMIGKTGYELCTGLDFEPTTNRAFAVCNRIIEDEGEGPIGDVVLGTRAEDPGQVLVQLDIANGQGTEIGPLNIVLDNTGVSDISFRPDGTLFGIVGIAPEVPRDDFKSKTIEFDEVTLVWIDKETGQASIVGPTGTGDSIDAIGFSSASSLYHATDNVLDPGSLNMLDHFTGNGTSISALDYPGEFGEDGVLNTIPSMDYANAAGKLFAFLISLDGRKGDPVDPESRVEFAEGSFLGTIDSTTGAIELIGMTSEFGNQFIALAALNRIERNVPTLSEYGLIATSVFLLIAAVVYMRRRQLKKQM